jgi:hypothetical protein
MHALLSNISFSHLVGDKQQTRCNKNENAENHPEQRATFEHTLYRTKTKAKAL